jgi:hypothetical protein
MSVFLTQTKGGSPRGGVRNPDFSHLRPSGVGGSRHDFSRRPEILKCIIVPVIFVNVCATFITNT